MTLGPTGDTARANVTRVRSESGVSFAALSGRMGELGRPMGTLALRRLESGERRVDVDDLLALAVALDVTPLSLLLPPVMGMHVEREVTALGMVPTVNLWRWATSTGPLDPHADQGARLEWHRRVAPREVLTDAQRHRRRAEWQQRRAGELEGAISRALRDTPDDEPREPTAVDRMFIEARTAELEQVRALDPADEEAWAHLGGLDPAPPAPGDADG